MVSVLLSNLMPGLFLLVPIFRAMHSFVENGYTILPGIIFKHVFIPLVWIQNPRHPTLKILDFFIRDILVRAKL